MNAAASPLPKFTGEHTRSLDSALRVSLPKEWRGLKIKEFYLYLTPGSANSHLLLMPGTDYDRKVADLMADTTLTREQRSAYLRAFGSQSQHVTLDNAERLTVPLEMCKRIGVNVKKPEVVFVGAVHTIEIWNPASFKAWTKTSMETLTKGKPLLNMGKYFGV